MNLHFLSPPIQIKKNDNNVTLWRLYCDVIIVVYVRFLWMVIISVLKAVIIDDINETIYWW